MDHESLMTSDEVRAWLGDELYSELSARGWGMPVTKGGRRHYIPSLVLASLRSHGYGHSPAGAERLLREEVTKGQSGHGSHGSRSTSSQESGPKARGRRQERRTQRGHEGQHQRSPGQVVTKSFRGYASDFHVEEPPLYPGNQVSKEVVKRWDALERSVGLLLRWRGLKQAILESLSR
jgi:hypothetical protein